MKSFLLFSLLCITSLLSAQLVNLESYATGFSSPIGIENAGDDRLFVLERSGFIQIIDGPGNVLSTPFLDIDGLVIFTGGFSEQGLLGLAFHPDYANNGYFFVHYTNNSGDGQISRFSVQADNPNRADEGSELKIMSIDQPFQNHNGGDLKFGPDGFLYIGLGDGGSANDPQGNGQDRETWLGKMLRIDVNNSTEAEPYIVPGNNPFLDDVNTLDEIWSIGLRNPWRYSFDRLTGDLYIGDVGQDAFAEIDFEAAGEAGGKNYGWRCYEANSPFNTSNCDGSDAYDFPIHQYPHGNFGGPCSITGGYVYRGCEYSDLFGKYIYADFCDGTIWALTNDNGNWTNEVARDNGGSWSGFGEDGNGALYICDMQTGIVHKITGNETYDLPVIEGDGSLTFTVNTGNLPNVTSYQWYDGDLVPGATSNTITVEGDGGLIVEVITESCSIFSEELLYVNVDQLAGVSEITISPNPFNNAFDLAMKAEFRKDFKLELINIQGQIMWEGNWELNGAGRKTIQVDELGSGVYYLKIGTEEGAIVRKVTKG